MCTTKLSPSAVTGSPEASINMPELSIATCPCGSHSTRKIDAASAGINRWTSNRSFVIRASCHRPAGTPRRRPDRARGSRPRGPHASFAAPTRRWCRGGTSLEGCRTGHLVRDGDDELDVLDAVRATQQLDDGRWLDES